MRTYNLHEEVEWFRTYTMEIFNITFNPFLLSFIIAALCIFYLIYLEYSVKNKMMDELIAFMLCVVIAFIAIIFWWAS